MFVSVFCCRYRGVRCVLLQMQNKFMRQKEEKAYENKTVRLPQYFMKTKDKSRSFEGGSG